MTAASECIGIPPAELVGPSDEPLVRIDTDPDTDPDADKRGRKPEALGRLVRTLAPPDGGDQRLLYRPRSRRLWRRKSA